MQARCLLGPNRNIVSIDSQIFLLKQHIKFVSSSQDNITEQNRTELYLSNYFSGHTYAKQI